MLLLTPQESVASFYNNQDLSIDSVNLYTKEVKQLYQNKAYDSCILKGNIYISFLKKNIEYKSLPSLYLQIAKSKRKLRKYSGGKEASQHAVYWSYKSADSILIADSYTELARNFKALTVYDSAILNYQKALIIYQDKNDFIGESIVLNNLGSIHKIKGNFSKALEYYIKDLDLNRENDSERDMAIAYNNIGQIHSATHNYQLAISFYKRSEEIRRKLNDMYGLALVLSNIASAYSEQKNIDLALDNLYVALTIFEKHKSIYRTTETLLNISNILIQKGQFRDAEIFLNKANKKSQKFEIENLAARGNYLLGENYFHQQFYKKALPYLRAAKHYYNQEHYVVDRINTQKLLYKTYQELGWYKKAFKAHKLWSDLYIKMNATIQTKELAVLNQKYLNKEQLLKIDRLNKEQLLQEEKLIYQNRVNAALIFISLLAVVFIIFIYISLQKRKKSLKIIKEQHEEISVINNELTDSLKYAHKIQRSLNAIPAKAKDIFQDYFIFWKPLHEVSGDVFSVSVKNDIVFISLMDFTGHGAPAALLATLGVKVLNSIIDSGISSPEKILQELDIRMNNLFDDKHESSGMDAAIVTINLKTNFLEFAGARRPLFYIDESGQHYIKGTKRSISDKLSNHHHSYQKHIIPITSELKFYLYSDGYQDQFGGSKNKKFLEKNLRQLIVDNSFETFNLQKEKLEKTRSKWMQPKSNIQYKPTDDTLIIGFHFKV
ncbi:tetratricopeptide repeat protein [Flammeovirga kamogawensis]|uniref:Tetratricopeptide repeat protein n=1 Tax=Flammeovirga kamogawensis TaxID=373891 RepID=A0ABX8GQS5_9BACT|nr:tetratricopeptide repeat protein [Flammeovirga kamogawensis]MBB6462046.1 serine phosphatase RsbU (regulator of sigma subunit) [Flammeovirga kamogawensis]QWG05781.1 tetratricopeptide repeat protein [Flammeovirga kamogawensis]TRX67608.1 tetratricopeptide repeat protein [Flammeovirga kamogawensis]